MIKGAIWDLQILKISIAFLMIVVRRTAKKSEGKGETESKTIFIKTFQFYEFRNFL